MTHDPLCNWWQNQCESDCNINLAYGDPCEHMWCTCALIVKVRKDQTESDIRKMISELRSFGTTKMVLNRLISAMRRKV